MGAITVDPISSQNDPQSRQRSASQIASAYQIANELLTHSLVIGFLIWGGYWADGALGCSPLLIICGACLGFVAAAQAIRQIVFRIERESRSRKAKPPTSR